jgi:hypothetical protein
MMFAPFGLITVRAGHVEGRGGCAITTLAKTFPSWSSHSIPWIMLPLPIEGWF